VSAVLAAAVLAAGWFDRSEVDRLEVGRPGRLVVVNDAGPIEVSEGEGVAVVEVAASYVLRGPAVEVAEGEAGTVVRVVCEGWPPCRAALAVQVPPGTTVEAVSPGDVVAFGPFTGEVTAVSGTGLVVLGPVWGPVRVAVGSAPVRAADLYSAEVVVEAVDGPVELAARVPPASLRVEAVTSPVVLLVPDGEYHLDVEGSPARIGDVEVARRAPSAVRIRSAGPVEVAPLPPDP
jgi:hypothetical protein